MVEGTGLENRRGATHRGFESLLFRQVKTSPFGLVLTWSRVETRTRPLKNAKTTKNTRGKGATLKLVIAYT